jgi:hypothetical protein
VPARIAGDQLKDVPVSLPRRRTWSPVADPTEIGATRPADVGRGRNPAETSWYPSHVPVEEVGVRVDIDEADLE